MHASFTAEEHYRRGRDLLRDGKEREAFDHFRTSYHLDPANPRYRSHYGLGLALAERRFDRALELCRSAAKEEFFNPELYHNLARVLDALTAKGIRDLTDIVSVFSVLVGYGHKHAIHSFVEMRGPLS